MPTLGLIARTCRDESAARAELNALHGRTRWSPLSSLASRLGRDTDCGSQANGLDRNELGADGRDSPQVGRRDPVIADAQVRLPGLRPCGFHSPYEAPPSTEPSGDRSHRNIMSDYRERWNARVAGPCL
jgi:hypothetical protein